MEPIPNKISYFLVVVGYTIAINRNSMSRVLAKKVMFYFENIENFGLKRKSILFMSLSVCHYLVIYM